MKKTKLEIDYTYDFALKGLISSAKNYKLAWDINRRLALKLVKKPDLIVRNVHSSDSYAYFSYETMLSTVKLFKNNSNSSAGELTKKCLAQEYAHVDYILMIQGMDEQDTSLLEEKMLMVNTIEMIVPMPLDTLRHKDFFIF